MQHSKFGISTNTFNFQKCPMKQKKGKSEIISLQKDPVRANPGLVPATWKSPTSATPDTKTSMGTLC